MAIQTTQLRRLLASDEPNYALLARLGGKILAQLAQLVTGQNEYVAANAVSLAGMIDHAQAIAVLERGVRSRSVEVRTAAAGALRHVKRPKATGLIADFAISARIALIDGRRGVVMIAIARSLRCGS